MDPDGRENSQSLINIEEVYFFGYGNVNVDLNGYNFSFQNIVFGDKEAITGEIQNLKNLTHDSYSSACLTVSQDTNLYLSVGNMNNTYKDIELIQNLKGTIYFSDQKAPDNFIKENRSSFFYYLSTKYYLITNNETNEQFLCDEKNIGAMLND